MFNQLARSPRPDDTADSALLRRVDRAVGDFRRGTPVLLHAGGSSALVQSVEGAEGLIVRRFMDAAGAAPLLAVAARRGAALGYRVRDDDKSLQLKLRDPERADLQAIVHPAMPAEEVGHALTGVVPADELTDAAVQLAKLARLLPAALIARLDTRDPELWAARSDIIALATEDIGLYEAVAARALRHVADARVPLAGAENARIHAFRPADGGIEHLAIVIGEPRPDEAVLARIHSECFTGDLLASLRCDCGDQLRGAIAAISEAGAGVLLYLAQEGRGIGLVNKLRAYRLQDCGADTLEANEALGFDADERVYLPAAEMLRQLGFLRVRLLTNNPDKVAALKGCGITVEERVAHRFPSNGHNDFYLSTKVRRFGHLP